ncbi:hypothetical protein WJX73_009122 [Symbiochloris irregularis]|uniref:Large ribosomal subunit protein uL4 C-terminal domain-containing protein n=1 Tax=Symbiochloris irregularis TaxID=706552 RepID=A0AAW1NPZ9_9CHLO
MAASRPMVAVHSTAGENTDQVALPAVFTAPIRPDIVQQVHTGLAKNKRQPYAVSFKAGHQTSAESWGTGRAVARIPRVPGGGTHRAGQGAFGNMCRGGRMFSPTKIWRRWHRKVNLNLKRYAVVSALAATALPSLVLARGHRIEGVAEVPLVVEDAAESLTKTKAALDLLKKVGALADATKAKESKNLRTGKGKMRNRRYTNRKGPLIVYDNDNGISKAFRNLPGVDVLPVDALNLLALAPGGHLGRFIIWTRSAFVKLDSIFGTFEEVSKQKGGYRLPRSPMINADLARLINSDEVQSVVRPPIKASHQRIPRHKNPLRNLSVMLRLNPYAQTLRRMELRAQEQRSKSREEGVQKKRQDRAAGHKAKAKEFYNGLVADSEYQGEDYEVFSSWLGETQAV